MKAITSLFTCITLCSFTGSAEELTPRSFTNLPIDQNFLGVAYAYTDGDLYTSPDVPLDDVTLRLQGEIAAYVRTFELFGNSAKFDVNLGHFCAEASATTEENERIHRNFCGLSDTKIQLTYNFFNAKALTLTEYVKTPKEIVAGISLQVGIPTGDYDKQYILNTGANRWFIRPEIGVSIPFNQWEFDASIGAKFFTDNDELKGTQTFKQDPIYNLQFHLIYNIKPGQWIALNTNYFDGGDTYVDGVKSGIKKGNNRAGLTYSMAIARQQSIKLFVNTGITTRLGNDSDAFGIAYSYRW